MEQLSRSQERDLATDIATIQKWVDAADYQKEIRGDSNFYTAGAWGVALSILGTFIVFQLS